MTDFSRDRLGPDDDDRLPWLEPVEEDPEEGGSRPAKLIAALVIALVVVGLIVVGVVWLRGRGGMAASGDGSLIRAPDSYYKERPADPGGMDVGSGDEIVYSASKGGEVVSNIDVSGAAEAPVNVERPAAPAPAAAPVAARPLPAKPVTDAVVSTTVAPPVAKPKPPAPKPVSVAPAPAVVTGGSMVQLGAFSSQAKANAAWKTLSGRFGFLGGLTQSVVPVQAGEKTLYRLRASGPEAAGVCAKLRTAGESCTVIG